MATKRATTLEQQLADAQQGVDDESRAKLTALVRYSEANQFVMI